MVSKVNPKQDLSAQEKALRAPLPPDVLIDARNEKIHIDVSDRKSRVAKCHRFKNQVQSKYKIQSDSTLTLWHGGNLEFGKENISHKGGRWEHGPGLYLTTHYDTARKYAKGSRKLYRVVIKKGVNIRDVDIPITAVQEFIDTYFSEASSA